MKKINIHIIGAVMIVGLLGQSCKKELIKINTDPTSLPDVAPEYLFTGTTADFNLTSRTQLINRYTFMTYMQYIVPDGVNANLGANYWAPGANTGPAPSVTYYSDYYSGVGVSMNRIIAKIDAMSPTQKTSYGDLRAICQVLNTYLAWQIVDIYGAMPYFQAFQPDKYPLPGYDFDFTLYKTFDSTLKTAATILNSIDPKSQVTLGAQDFFYGGDIPSWEAFANTLRIKIAQRFEKRDPANLASVLTDIATNFSNQIISGNAQSFGYSHTPGWNTNVDDINNLLLNYDAGYAFVEFLKSTNDPRTSLLLRQNDFGTNDAIYNNVKTSGTPAAIATLDSPGINTSRYWGKHAFPASEDPAYGWTGAGRFQSFNITGQTSPASLGFLSTIQTRYFLKDGGFGGFDARSSQSLMHTDEPYVDKTTIKNRTLYLTYAETCFMMAEIAQKGGNGFGKSAEQWYDAGVQASFDQYKADGITAGVPGADTAVIGDYLTRNPYNASTGLQQIYSQAWVHFMTEPEESWAMWKRTGYPQFTDVRVGNNGNIGNGSGTAYLESLWNGSQNLIIPRRAAFTVGNAGSVLNQTSFTQAIATMQAKNPDYGVDGNYAIGRIWWDMK
ncbi:MAG: SusD/RagB family nutrient-binding outer membrane lipoprotein [Bacteroidota bacterium]|nr:SusD/RagB family nutrient-binding outer membrane lipoprotein [Bacteroidota bacterium]